MVHSDIDIASDIVVFRYSQPKLLEYLVKKATRLGNGDSVKRSRTLERELAKDGLMDDGKEALLQCIVRFVQFGLDTHLSYRWARKACMRHDIPIRFTRDS